MPKVHLTDITVKSLKATSAQTVFWDDSLPGFGCRVSGSTRAWVVMYGPARSRQLKTIGRYPLLSLQHARTEAKRILLEHALGKTRLRSIFFENALQLFLENCQSRIKPRTLRDYDWLLRRYFLPTLAREPLDAISTPEMARIVHRLRDTPTNAVHALMAAKIFFNWARRNGYVAVSPCEAMPPPARLLSRERVLTDAELKAVFEAALADSYPYGTIILLLILTGQRRGEIAALRWEWIDETDRTITLPAALTKNGRQHKFPHSRAVTDILAALPYREGYLFPASREQVRGKASTIFNGWSKSAARLRARCGVEFRLHDLRRTFATNLAKLGTAPHVVEKLLNHASGTISGVAAIYNQFQYMDEMRSAIEAWDAKLASLMTG